MSLTYRVSRWFHRIGKGNMVYKFEDFSEDLRIKISSSYKTGENRCWYPTDPTCKNLQCVGVDAVKEIPYIYETELMDAYYAYLRG